MRVFLLATACLIVGTVPPGLAWFAGHLRLRRATGDSTPDVTTAADSGCAGCGGRAHRMPDQRVPDPAQFVPDPRRDGTKPVQEIATVTAPMVWCTRCRTWLHAVGCYSTHHHPDWKPAPA